MMDKDRGRGVCEEKVILELIFLEDACYLYLVFLLGSLD